MAVLIEAINIVVNNNALIKDTNVEEQFLKNVPSQTYCSDGLVHRLGFMDQISANNYIHYLTNDLGLTYLDENDKAIDFVVVDMLKGPTKDCDWIRFKRDKLFAHREEFDKSDEDFSAAWRRGDFEGKDNEYIVEIEHGESADDHDFYEEDIATPYGWSPDDAIYTSTYHPNRRKDLEEVSRTEYMITYKNKETGELYDVERRRWIGKDTIRKTKEKITKELRKIISK